MTTDFDEICNIIKNQLIESKGQRFNQLLETLKKMPKTKSLSTTTLTRHLRDHLVYNKFVSINNDHEYIWNPQKVSYIPPLKYLLLKLEYTIEGIKNLKQIKYQDISMKLSETWKNQSDEPQNSILYGFNHYLPQTWEQFNPQIHLRKEAGTTYFFDKKKSDIFFIDDNPYHHVFRLDFPLPLFKDEEIEVTTECRDPHPIDVNYIDVGPYARTEKIEIIMNFPNSNYELKVYEIDTLTGKLKISNIQPIKAKNKITWITIEHSPNVLYRFEWSKLA